MKSVNTYSTEGVVVSSVDYDFPDSTKRKVLNALKTIRQNPDILECQIDGSSVTWIQFDSTIDDAERKPITDWVDNFQTDVHRIIVKKSGEVIFKAYGKWSEDFLTFEVE
jgi:hypothetical protein